MWAQNNHFLGCLAYSLSGSCVVETQFGQQTSLHPKPLWRQKMWRSDLNFTFLSWIQKLRFLQSKIWTVVKNGSDSAKDISSRRHRNHIPARWYFSLPSDWYTCLHWGWWVRLAVGHSYMQRSTKLIAPLLAVNPAPGDAQDQKVCCKTILHCSTGIGCFLPSAEALNCFLKWADVAIPEAEQLQVSENNFRKSVPKD